MDTATQLMFWAWAQALAVFAAVAPDWAVAQIEAAREAVLAILRAVGWPV